MRKWRNIRYCAELIMGVGTTLTDIRQKREF